jgi:hypothetical protein
MNTHLQPLVSQKRVSIDDARLATTDRVQLDQIFQY